MTSLASRALPYFSAALALTVAGCSGGEAVTEEEAAASQDPAGAAQPLSLGGRFATEDEGEFAIAVNCAAALSLTKDRLAQMVDNPQSREIAVIDRAENHFAALAAEASEADEGTNASPAVAIERRRSEKQAETIEQAQLAMACLRRFGSNDAA